MKVSDESLVFANPRLGQTGELQIVPALHVYIRHSRLDVQISSHVHLEFPLRRRKCLVHRIDLGLPQERFSFAYTFRALHCQPRSHRRRYISHRSPILFSQELVLMRALHRLDKHIAFFPAAKHLLLAFRQSRWWAGHCAKRLRETLQLLYYYTTILLLVYTTTTTTCHTTISILPYYYIYILYIYTRILHHICDYCHVQMDFAKCHL